MSSPGAAPTAPLLRSTALRVPRFWLYVLATVVIAALPLVFTDSYWRTNLVVCAINVLLAIGLDFILGYAGQLNLGQSAFYGIGAYVSTLLIMRLGVPFWPAFACGVALAGVSGMLLSRVRRAPARPLSRHRLARLRGHHLPDPAQLDQPHPGAARHLRHPAAAAARTTRAAFDRLLQSRIAVLSGRGICAPELPAARPIGALARSARR